MNKKYSSRKLSLNLNLSEFFFCGFRQEFLPKFHPFHLFPQIFAWVARVVPGISNRVSSRGFFSQGMQFLVGSFRKFFQNLSKVPAGISLCGCSKWLVNNFSRNVREIFCRSLSRDFRVFQDFFPSGIFLIFRPGFTSKCFSKMFQFFSKFLSISLPKVSCQVWLGFFPMIFPETSNSHSTVFSRQKLKRYFPGIFLLTSKRIL